MKNEFGITKTQVKILFFAATITLTSCDDNFIVPPPPISPQPQDRTPAWSSDGQWIAYFHFTQAPDTAQYSTGIYLSDEFGQQRNQISKNFGHNPDWSPDGKRIVFDQGDIFTIGANGDSLTRLTYGGNRHFPSWSPNAVEIAFDRSGTQDTVGIWILNSQSMQEKRIGFGSDPDWSSDGKKLVYSGPSGMTQSQSQIWVIEIGSMNKNQLTFNPYPQNNYPTWSPDGKKIAWMIGRGGGEIWIMEADGSNQYKLMDGVEPSWSPDSEKIVFARAVQPVGRMVLWIINIDGTNLRQLTN